PTFIPAGALRPPANQGCPGQRLVPSARGLVNRFFRSALFPLIIIAALVWLALQTLGRHGTKQEKATLSEVIQRVSTAPQSIDQAVFVPSKQELDVTLRSGG